MKSSTNVSVPTHGWSGLISEKLIPRACPLAWARDGADYDSQVDAGGEKRKFCTTLIILPPQVTCRRIDPSDAQWLPGKGPGFEGLLWLVATSVGCTTPDSKGYWFLSNYCAK